MRLLQINNEGEVSLNTKEFLITDMPRYAILSHTWGAAEDEVSYDDLKNGRGKNKPGYAKLQFCGKQATSDGINYFWVDTCCINNANHPELSEAIVSMYKLYKNAVRCYVYLSDVKADPGSPNHAAREGHLVNFKDCRWFTRGWTLQELIAPTDVRFFTQDACFLADKISLQEQIQEITGIPADVLRGRPLSEISVPNRLRWVAHRETTKIEDRAYCMLGIFDICMALIYGEGEEAFYRLVKEIDEKAKARSKKHVDLIAASLQIVEKTRSNTGEGQPKLKSIRHHKVMKYSNLATQSTHGSLKSLNQDGQTKLVDQDLVLKQKRVRENQRRARARRQEYLAELERKLLESQYIYRELSLQQESLAESQIR